MPTLHMAVRYPFQAAAGSAKVQQVLYFIVPLENVRYHTDRKNNMEVINSAKAEILYSRRN